MGKVIKRKDAVLLAEKLKKEGKNLTVTRGGEAALKTYKDTGNECSRMITSDLDNQFRFVKSFAHQPVIYTSQGMHCDDSYIYCIQSDNSSMVIG